jgi:hypothetical protein
MRLRLWVFLLLCLFAVSLLFFQLSSASADLHVNEAATKFLLDDGKTGASLVLENPLGRNVAATVRVELINPQGVVRSSAAQEEIIKEGTAALFISLPFQPSKLKDEERNQLLWYRLRYHIKPKDSSSVTEKPLEGVISLSAITPDLFEVHVVSAPYTREGALYRARVRAIHPLDGHPIEGVRVEAQIRIEEDDDKKLPIILSAKGITSAEGYAALDFNLPRGIRKDSADIKVTARRGLLVQEADDTIQLDQLSRIFISTDKPLYQPGQTLHARALIFSPLMQAIANEEMPFKIEDPEGTIVFRAQLKTSRFGTASIDWPVPENTRLGQYTIAFGRTDESYASYRIRISRYDLPNFTTSVKPDHSFYLPGQNAEVEVRADYLFGQRVRRGRVRVVRETEHEWNYREQKWETKEGDKYEGETNAEGLFIARVNLQAEHNELKDSDWQRFRDVTYAAYFTDISTGRTEQRRFDLRVTKEAIHVYVVGETYNQSSRLPLEFYVSTSYADGTPARCVGLISKGASDDTESEISKTGGGGRRVATFKTNVYGLAKLSIPKPPVSDDDDDKVYLRFYAHDATAKVGHRNEDFNYKDNPAIRVHTDKTLHRRGEPVVANLISSEKNLAVILDISRDLEVLRSELVHLKDGRGSVTIPYDDQFRGELVVTAYANTGARDEIYDSHALFYPRDKDLRLDVRPQQTTYRPGQEAHVNFDVLSPDGSKAESALGVVVFDKAVEERARSDQEFGSGFNLYGNYGGLLGWDERVSGVSRKDLEHLDLSKPIPEGLELLAEAMLNRNGSYSPNKFSGRNYELGLSQIFAPLINAQLKPALDTLNARYKTSMEYPADETALRRILSESGINFDRLFDPWGTPYHSLFYVENQRDMLKILSAGADKRFDTADDFSVAVLSWPYFRPIGEAIDRAVQKYHERTGGYIRDAGALQSELLRVGVDFGSLRDRWGEPYRVRFDVRDVNYVLNVMSGGPDKRVESHDIQGGDFIIWSSMIDYFAERRAEIGLALNSQLKETRRFPQSMKELRETLGQSKIDFDALRDAWGREYYATFKVQSRFTDRVTIETRSQYGEKAQTQTAIKPVTQKVCIVTLRSAGADRKQGTADDFNAATFSLILSEQGRDDSTPQPAHTSAILSGKGGAIVGTITDSNDAVVPSATVRATLLSTQLFYEAATDDEGKFILRDLPLGTYEVRATASGFSDTVVTDVLVSNSNILTLDLTLQPGPGMGVVEVTSTSEPTLNTSDSALSFRQITELPLNGKKVSNLLALRRGAVNVVTKSGLSQDSTPRLREYFPETLLWQPLLETDAQGRAELRFKLADNITTWKLAVIGSTMNGEIGMAEKEILAFQPFFIEHDPPRILTEGDTIQLPVVLRNYLAKSQVVELGIKPESWFTLLGPAQKRAEVAAGDNSRQTFDFRAVASIEDGKQRITATGADVSDQIERPVSVHPDGEEIAKTTSVILSDSAKLDADIPTDAINATPRAELKIYPNLMAHVVESIEGIMRRPYGCAEQSISAAYPSLLVLRAYEHIGKEPPAIAAKARRYVQAGYERLLNYRTPDGGFSYWGRGGADPALTAYALRFLHDAEDFVEVDEGVVKEAREWLVKQQRGDGSWPATRVWWEKTEDKRRTAVLTAYIARVLAMTNDKDAEEKTANDKTTQTVTPAPSFVASATTKRALNYLSRIYLEIDEPYLIASYALAASNAGDLKGAKDAIEKLRALAHEEAGANYWTLETNTPFYGWGLAGRIETTALVLQALKKYCEVGATDCGPADTNSSNQQSVIGNPNPALSQLIDRGLLFLLRAKDRYGVWYSTQATVNTLDTLVSLLSKDSPDASDTNGAVAPHRTDAAGEQAQVFINGRPAITIELPPENQLATPILVDISRFISTGNNHVEIRREMGSPARASVQMVYTYYVPWSTREAASHAVADDAARALRLGVSYDKSAAGIGSEITCRVEAERIGFRGYGMLLAEIGLPPGADVDRASLELAMKQDEVSQYDVLPDRLIVYLWPQAGGSNFTFKFRTRFGITAQTAPSLLYDYYNPEAHAVVAPTKFVIGR